MVKTPKKPEGFEDFKRLLGAISQVPKKEVDREVEKSLKRAERARKKKK